MLSDKERIGTLEAQVSALQARLARLEARFPEAKPDKPATPPAWAPPPGDYGAHAQPTEAYIEAGRAAATAKVPKPREQADGRWQDGGVWRNAEGEIVGPVSEPVRGPDARPRSFDDDVIERMTPLQGGH